MIADVLSAAGGVSRETADRLEAYVALLARWNEVINLVGRADRSTIWCRHIADSLQLLPLLGPHRETLIDLGSGAGLPGLVIAIATGISVTLIEADARKAAFLAEATRITGARARVLNVRVESARVARAPIVTARALAPIAKLLPWIELLLAAQGRAVLPKGAMWQKELRQAQREWQFALELYPSVTDPRSRIVLVSDLKRKSTVRAGE